MCTEKYKILVERLEADHHETTNWYGQTILLKSIPDFPAMAGFDPRVNEIRKSAVKSKLLSVSPPSIHQIREGMGWPNSDITSGKTSVSYDVISGRNGDIPVRIYKYRDKSPSPCIVFIHGGGFFGGSLDVVENPCRYLSYISRATVISVDYRLAPEYPFPAGLNDCVDAIQWIYHHPQQFNIIAGKIGVCGDSAGGNLAAVCSLIDRDTSSGMIRFLAMLYPVVNVGSVKSLDYEWNILEYDAAYVSEMVMESVFETGELKDFLIDVYLSRQTDLCDNPYVSPIFSASLENMPPTIIVSAEYDYLRIEGEAYARKLQKSGVPVTLIQYKGLDHAFMDKLGLFPQAEDALKEISKAFRYYVES